MANKLTGQLRQRLGVTPALKQAIGLLQKSNSDLTQEVLQVVQDNPFLEAKTGREQEETEWSDPQNESGQLQDTELTDWLNNLGEENNSLSQELHAQLSLMSISEQDEQIASIIIESLDDNGFLPLNNSQLLDLTKPLFKPTTPSDIKRVLKLIQSMEPTGVGARNLQECLSIQLSSISANNEIGKQALNIVDHHFDFLSVNNIQAIKKLTRLRADELELILKLIRSLNPRPGSAFVKHRTEYISPDLIASKKRAGWEVQLNKQATPQVSINKTLVDSFKASRVKSDADYLKHNLSEANQLIRSLEVRNQTLLEVGKFLVTHQSDFLDSGDTIQIRPLNLKTIAESTEVHVSTVSRITQNKFIETPRGTVALKNFLSGTHKSLSGNVEISSVRTQVLIREITSSEDPKRPLSDSKIAELLRKQDINVARRTIAKYRNQMAIPSSPQRKNRM